MREVLIDIGVNGAFLTRRWETPETFMALTRDTGFTYHEFCADVLDPFFSGDETYQKEVAERVRRAAGEYGVVITDYYTGVATHRFHGLSHSSGAVRARMRRWIERAMDIALALGTDRVGGHWDAIPVERLNDPALMRRSLDDLYREFRELAALARDKGIATISNEQMYIPSEIPWTLAGAEEFLVEVNAGNDGCPVYLTVDTGHQAGVHYGASGDELEYIRWLERFASVCEIVHVQQTTPDASMHWPFTEEFNRRGHVKIDQVLAAIERSHRDHAQRGFAQCLRPVTRTILVLEYIPGSTTTEQVVLDSLKESCAFLRSFVPDGGITLRFD
jgi:sugar phosphate isomerase/epimerase